MGMNVAQKSFVVDQATTEAIDRLKGVFGVTTTAAVIRKALALASVAAEHADGQQAITLVDKNDSRTKILLSA